MNALNQARGEAIRADDAQPVYLRDKVAATSYAYVNPAVAVLLGIVFIGETIGLEEALAMLVIISAVLLISLPQWRKPKAEIR